MHHAAAGDRNRFLYSAAYVVDRPNSVIPELEAAGITVHRLDPTLGPVGWARSLRRLVRKERIDVVHLHSPAVAASSRIALRSMRSRPSIITTEHNSADCYAIPTRLANIATYGLDDHRIAVSRDAIESVPRAFRGRSEIVVHGIDLEHLRARADDRAAVRAELGIASSAPVVITVANHRREKAWDVLLAAASALVRQHPDVVFLGVGHGQLEEENRAELARLQLGDSFRMLGFRRDAERLVAASDVFVLASRREGTPVAAMEAMALGLPIVATSVGGMPDIIVSEHTGLLVEPEDPQALAAALGRLVAAPDLRTALGRAARVASDRFDVRKVVALIEDRYELVSRRA